MGFDIKNREKREWCRYWWDNADDERLPRVLLIGDSITDNYRAKVSENLVGKVYVDMYASSRAVNDPAYLKELSHALEEYPYIAIHYNNGLHGWHETKETYSAGVANALDLIIIKQPEAKVVLATSTPVTDKGELRSIDTAKDEIICSRNDVMKEAAKKHGFEVNDLYLLMMENLDTQSDDGVHYLDQGETVQAKQVAAIIIKQIG